MDEGLREEKYKEINATAREKKREVSYILGVIEKHKEMLLDIFPTEMNFLDETFSMRIYDKVKEAIEGIKEYCYPGRYTIKRPLVSKSKHLEVRLGWIKEEKVIDGPDRNIFNYHMNPGEIKVDYILSPTEEGLNVLDGLREIRGQVPIRGYIEKRIIELIGYIKKEQ